MKKYIPLLLLCTGVTTITAAEKPNFVILFVDDLGWADLGYQNTKFDTPNINQLKDDGIYYSRTYVSTATSSPSRASLLTGREALRCGFVRHIYDVEDPSAPREEFQTLSTDPAHMKSRAWLPLEEITYAERLKEMGYYNMFVGKWHLGHEPYYPTKQGFDAMYGTCEHGHPRNYYAPFFKTEDPFPNAREGEDYLTNMLTDGAVNFITEYDKQQPFLLNMWYYGVHGPQHGRRDLIAKYESRGMNHIDAVQAAMIEAIDESVGRVRETLERCDMADNTVIIFSSDQGGAFSNAPLSGGKKGGNTLADGGSRVPMIIYNPMASSNGVSYDKAVETLDIYPTLVEMASNKKCKDRQIQGVSLVPTFNGKELKDRDLFLHRSYEDQNSAIVRGDYKLIKYRSGKLELFDLKNDVGESTNLVDAKPKLRDQMLTALTKWQEEATPKELY
ncbi:MAG: sulfatase [Rikenellaceae bacterium]